MNVTDKPQACPSCQSADVLAARRLPPGSWTCQTCGAIWRSAVRVVLLFSNVARADLAARLHAPTCAMVNVAKGRRGATTRQDNPTAEDLADLNARGWPVKRCKCLPPEGST